ncbi:MAG: SDR family oxidoreductase [Acidimicrobiia bacterium]|nr:SDR family NAD(P)-dependent oxidoreductase [bacterium]MXW59291.1 SDR family oxidoreductase [Acidimicrobiia bacterium]MYB73262.1 SDR family oxidoreductase [Acidimicrobiia bacterium]MYH99245.1 SDR family oxidoreductase [Acidimicrobiia bacterium]
MKLEEKVVVVTGAGRGIGREIALTCAQEGGTMVLAARSVGALQEVAEQIESAGGEAMVAETDVCNPDAVAALTDEVLSRWGRVDVLVNNSGIGGPSAPLWEVQPEDWEETFAVNVTGVYRCCQAMLPSMIKRQNGSIINIGSITGKRPLLNRTPYAASKAALIGLTRTLALETGPHQIRVNLVSPGLVAGERIEWVFEQQATIQGRSADDVRADLEEITPLRRLVSATDVARTVAFLASDESEGITGADINVTAGLVMY